MTASSNPTGATGVANEREPAGGSQRAEDAPRDSLCNVGEGCVPYGVVLVAIGLALAAGILAIYALIAVWPQSQAAIGTAATKPQPSIAFLGWHFKLSSDARLFVVVAIAGSLGGMVHTLRSLSWYVGNRYLKWSWLPFYLLLPVMGGSLAVVFYLVLRAGLFSPSTDTKDANVYGFAALAALVGLFTEQALEKLREVFSSVLTQAPQGKDTAKPADAPGAMTGEARDVAATEAMLAGKVTPRSRDTKVQFAYGLKAPEYGQVAPARTVAASETEADLEVKVSGLVPNTEYHFRIEAESDAGKSFGADKTFKTPPA